MFFMSINSTRNNAVHGLSVILFFVSTFCFGQVEQPNRIEIPIPEEGKENYTVVSAQMDGLVLYQKLRGKRDDQLEIIRLDTLLNEVWKGYIGLERDLVPVFKTVYQNVLFILLKNQDALKANFWVVFLDLQTRSYKVCPVNNFILFNPTEFVATSDAVMIGGYFNYRPLVLYFSFTTQKSKILPGFFNEPGELLQLKPNENGTFDVIVASKNIDRRTCLWIRNYDSDGGLIKTTVLEPDPGKNFIFGRSVKTPDQEQVVAGVYGKTTEFSRGIFVAHINAYGEYKINYYNFGDLENFFSYMKAKREKRVKERIERRKIKGKKIRFNYRFLVHELVPYGDQFILLGEAFYPEYKSGYSMYGGGYSSYTYPMSSARNDMVFNGYKYTHAVAIDFAKNGTLLWDNSFEINDVKSFKLEQFVKIQPEENHITLLYLFENTIRSKIIKGAQVLEGKTLEEIKTKYEGDEVRSEGGEVNKLEYWYPGHFYAYGEQRIRNPRIGGVPPVRRVFFINKIVNK